MTSINPKLASLHLSAIWEKWESAASTGWMSWNKQDITFSFSKSHFWYEELKSGELNYQTSYWCRHTRCQLKQPADRRLSKEVWLSLFFHFFPELFYFIFILNCTASLFKLKFRLSQISLCHQIVGKRNGPRPIMGIKDLNYMNVRFEFKD